MGPNGEGHSCKNRMAYHRAAHLAMLPSVGDRLHVLRLQISRLPPPGGTRQCMPVSKACWMLEQPPAAGQQLLLRASSRLAALGSNARDASGPAAAACRSGAFWRAENDLGTPLVQAMGTLLCSPPGHSSSAAFDDGDWTCMGLV